MNKKVHIDVILVLTHFRGFLVEIVYHVSHKTFSQILSFREYN
jgi:hypothetical protein